jgi:Tfp pilus assembly PilM family ATPase
LPFAGPGFVLIGGEGMSQIFDLFKPKRLERVVVVDLGASSTKAVYLERRGDQVVLLGYVILPGVLTELKESLPVMTEHLRNIHQTLGAKKCRHLSIALSPLEGVFRNVELPVVPVASLRGMLKNNSRQYLHLELGGYEVDCAVVSQVSSSEPTTARSGTGKGFSNETGGQTSAGRAQPRQNVLMGAAERTLVDHLEEAAAGAGLILNEVTFTQSALINTARHSCQSLLADNAMALIDIGSKATSISILLEGEAVLNRIIPIGCRHMGEKLEKEPGKENGKVHLSGESFECLEKAAQPLMRELRASIDFFEQVHERIVSQALFTGGLARTESAVIRVMQDGLVVPRCQLWNIAETVTLELSDVTAASFLNDEVQLGSALGLAETLLTGREKPINLLAARQEEADLRRRDPVKRSLQVAAVLIGLMLLWGLVVRLQIFHETQELAHVESELAAVRMQADAVTRLAQKVAATEAQRSRLRQQWVKRFLWTGPLNALQFSMVDGVEVVRLQLERTLITTPAVKSHADANGRVTQGKPASVTHKMTLLISARDSGDLPATEKFIASLAAQPYFKERLREKDPVLLRERLPQQLDPLDASKRFIPFTIQCVFKEWRTNDE